MGKSVVLEACVVYKECVSKGLQYWPWNAFAMIHWEPEHAFHSNYHTYLMNIY